MLPKSSFPPPFSNVASAKQKRNVETYRLHEIRPPRKKHSTTTTTATTASQINVTLINLGVANTPSLSIEKKKKKIGAGVILIDEPSLGACFFPFRQLSMERVKVRDYRALMGPAFIVETIKIWKWLL